MESVIPCTSSFIFGFIEMIGTIFLSACVFRIPFRSLFYPFILMAAIISLYNVIALDILNIDFEISEPISIFFHIVLVKFLYRIKVWMSIAWSCISYLIVTVIDAIIASSLRWLSILPNAESIIDNENLPLLYFVQLLHFLCCIVLGSLILKKGYGFLFIERNAKLPEKWTDMRIVTTIFFAGSLITTFYSFHFIRMHNRLISIVSGIITVIAGIAIWITYIKNRNEIQEYYKDKYPSDYLPK